MAPRRLHWICASALLAACTPARPASDPQPAPAQPVAPPVARTEPPKPQTKQEACDAGDGQACVDSAVEFFNGEKVTRDFVKARALNEKACATGRAPEGCFNLGVMFARGWGVPKNEEKGDEWYRRSCAAGFAAGCLNLGIAYTTGAGVDEDDARAAELYARGCELGNLQACFNYAVQLENGDAVPQDVVHAYRVFDGACEKGDAPSCDRAATLLDKACEAGSKEACAARARAR